VVSLLPALWVICFSIAGLTGASLARRFGSGPTLAAALVLLAAGSAARALPDTAALLAGSAVAAVGIALANVLLPAAVRTYFPHRIGAVTGVYTTALSAGSALAAALAVPAAHAFGGASEGLIVWAPPAVLALLVWSLSGRARRAHATRQAADGTARPHIPLRNLLRSRLAWTMAVFFGLQSTSAYVVMGWLPTILHDDGLSTSAAGTVLSVGLLVSIPLSLLAPLLAVRLGDSRPLVWLLSASFAAGFAGLDVAATGGAYLWAVLLGVGMAVFPLVLARLGVLGGSPAGTAALSTFAQGVGYLIAAIGPYGLGLLRNAVGSWTVPLVLMAGVATLQAVIGGYVMSPRRRAIAPGTVETGGRR
jgi:CP family cyanate transporter-like MFS transporter